MKGFAAFLMRGNVIDLAVAVVIGGAFGAVVTALVKDLLTPLIAAIVGKPDFSSLAFTLNNSRFAYGDFINAVLTFIIVAASIYYFVVLPIQAVTARLRPPAPEGPAVIACPECLSEVPAGARRCRYCTATIASS